MLHLCSIQSDVLRLYHSQVEKPHTSDNLLALSSKMGNKLSFLNMKHRSKYIHTPKNTSRETPLPEQKTPEDIAIDTIIDRFLHNEHINQRFIPDAMERRIYRNTLKMVVAMLRDTVEHAGITVLGHRIQFVMTPLSTIPEGDLPPPLTHFIQTAPP